MTRTRADIPLILCGEQCQAKTDVCIVDEDDIILLVQEDKEWKDPESQLIAVAIAPTTPDERVSSVKMLSMPT
jgi:hypothetical protein